jgi:membrane protein YqaA with SNARE-associated domain
MALNGRLNAAAFVWGLAEATLFFIVPDVPLSAAALTRLRAALAACVWATAGALVGGLLMYAWGSTSPMDAWGALDRIPGIAPSMAAGVREAMAEHGLGALFLGPLTGKPYKLYAVAAGQRGSGLGAFLLASVPARAIRFVLVSLLVRAISRPVPEPFRLQLLAVCWLVFYVGYFYYMGW